MVNTKKLIFTEEPAIVTRRLACAQAVKSGLVERGEFLRISSATEVN